MMGRLCCSVVTAALLALVPAEAFPATPTQCTGRPNAGTLRNGRELAPRPYLAIKHSSVGHTWGHPQLLQLVSGAAFAVANAVPGSVALVGDLSAEFGGFLSGHGSHQVGLDADVAFYVSNAQGAVALVDFEPFDALGRSLAHPGFFFDTYRNWILLSFWLSELRAVVTHVFVSPELRALLLDYGRQSPEFVRHVPLAIRVLQAHPNHADHFHIRIACPSDQGPACLDSAGQP